MQNTAKGSNSKQNILKTLEETASEIAADMRFFKKFKHA